MGHIPPSHFHGTATEREQFSRDVNGTVLKTFHRACSWTPILIAALALDFSVLKMNFVPTGLTRDYHLRFYLYNILNAFAPKRIGGLAI